MVLGNGQQESPFGQLVMYLTITIDDLPNFARPICQSI